MNQKWRQMLPLSDGALSVGRLINFAAIAFFFCPFMYIATPTLMPSINIAIPPKTMPYMTASSLSSTTAPELERVSSGSAVEVELEVEVDAVVVVDDEVDEVDEVELDELVELEVEDDGGSVAPGAVGWVADGAGVGAQVTRPPPQAQHACLAVTPSRLE